MAKYFNVSHHTINNFAKRINFDDSLYKKKELSDDEIRYIIENYDKKSSSLISSELNITASTINGVWFRNDLRGKDKRVYYLMNEDYFENIDSQDKAYFLGFIASDGCIHNNKEKQDILRIQIRKEDIKILELLKKQLNTNKPINKIKDYVTLEISSEKVVNDIKNKNISYKKTYGNTIANIDLKYMPAFIRGYFDGDGSISFNESISISIAGYKSNMIKLIDYLESKNILSSFVQDKRKYNHENNDEFGALVITNKNMAYSFIKLIYENSGEFYMDRKKEIADTYIKFIDKSENIRDKQIQIYYKYAVQKLG